MAKKVGTRLKASPALPPNISSTSLPQWRSLAYWTLEQTVSSLLATAGIGGIALAFGAQNLVRDVVSGMFLLLENLYAVGEYIEIDSEKGTVEAITVRTTRIQRFTGETTTIPNGSITKVTNYSRGDHLAVIDMSISYEADIEKASALMQAEGLAYMQNHDNILEEPHVLGIYRAERLKHCTAYDHARKSR